MELIKALVQYQYDEAPDLSFKFLPNRLVNKSYCETLSDEIINSFGNTWERLVATKDLALSLPSLPGIYMFVWKPYFNFAFDDYFTSLHYVVYIGKAGGPNENSTFKSRYKSEYAKIVKRDAEEIWKKNEMKCRKDRLNKFLNLWELEYWFIVMKEENRHVIKKYEEKLIQLFNPPGNTSGLRAKYGKSKPAF